jgi:hypothetical protein
MAGWVIWDVLDGELVGEIVFLIEERMEHLIPP